MAASTLRHTRPPHRHDFLHSPAAVVFRNARLRSIDIRHIDPVRFIIDDKLDPCRHAIARRRRALDDPTFSVAVHFCIQHVAGRFAARERQRHLGCGCGREFGSDGIAEVEAMVPIAAQHHLEVKIAVHVHRSAVMRRVIAMRARRVIRRADSACGLSRLTPMPIAVRSSTTHTRRGRTGASRNRDRRRVMRL